MKFIYQIEPRFYADKQGSPIQDQKPIFEAFVSGLFTSKYPEGIKNPISRKLDDIFRKLDSAEENFIELDQGEIALLKGVFCDEEQRIHPLQTRIYNAIRRNFEDTLELAREEAKKK